ncbi:MAG: hypothetical protein ACU0A8_02325 [Limimaricola soesokkakensis]|uniref:hypothetical protein n=1 Tax=Limimaricola soesokkakensis TaxID=1343159 RepID=UPI004059D866
MAAAVTANAWHGWLEQISGIETIAALILIGAGAELDIVAARASNADRILIVDPNPAAVTKFETLATKDPRIKVHPLAIGNYDGTATLHVSNAPGISSLRELSSLEALFPGLQTVATHEVRSATLESFLAQADLEGGGNVVLRLNAFGSEAAVVKALCERKVVSHLFMRSPRAPLAEGDQPSAALQAYLEKNDYRCWARDARDGDFLDQWFWHDAARKCIRTLEQSLAEAHREAEMLRQDARRMVLLESDLSELRARFEAMNNSSSDGDETSKEPTSSR